MRHPIVRGALACALVAGVVSSWQPQDELTRLHNASFFREGDAWARIERELIRSIEAAYAPTTGQGAKRVAKTLAFTKEFILVYGNRLYVSESHESADKHKPHYFFSTLLSIMKRAPLANFAATWDVAATGTHCRSKMHDVPCLAIAKQPGFADPGILVPNPYFAHVDEWDRRVAAWRAARPAWGARSRKVFWRGSVKSYCSFGNVARLAALSLTLERPERFDVRVTGSIDAPEAAACAEAFAYTKAMTALSEDADAAAKVLGAFVNASDFGDWRRFLNLPGTMGGSYSRNLNLLWPMGGVVALWDGPAVEWYYPGLKDGETHATLTAKTAEAVVDAVEGGPKLERRFAKQADEVHDAFLCGDCLDRYWRAVARHLRDYFGFAAVLDRTDAAFDADLERKALAGLDCAALRRVDWIDPTQPFYDETPGRGKPVAYAALDDTDPLFAACRAAKGRGVAGRRRR